MAIQCVVLSNATSSALTDEFSTRAQDVTISTNNRGFAEAEITVPMRAVEAFRIYDSTGLPHLEFRDNASGIVYQGRVEDIDLTEEAVTLRAFGYNRAMSDAPYTALWSTTDLTAFRPLTAAEVANRKPELYKFDTNNRIGIILPQGSIYATGADIGTIVYQVPDTSSRQIIGVMFDAVVNIPNGWIFAYVGWDAAWNPVANATIYASAGATQPVNKFFTFSASAAFSFDVYNNTGGNYTVNNAPNVWSVAITNVRLVTATTNKVDTTTTGAVGAGAGVSVPVVSSARMYVGQRLHIGIPASNGIGVIVTSVPDATHFVADLSAGFAGGTNVQAFVIYADEIVKDAAATTTTQLSSNYMLVQSPQRDLFDELYEDEYPDDIADRLVGIGDNQSPPRLWEWGVNDRRMLYMRAQGSQAQTWYADIETIEVQRTLDELWNSVYAVYRAQGGRDLRTVTASDASSIARYGITRRQAIGASTSDVTQANAQRDAALNDTKDPSPRSGVTITRLYDKNGSRLPLHLIRAGDTLVLRNLPATLTVGLDRVRSFRVVRTTYHPETETMELEPETPLASLDALLSMVVPPTWVTAPWWQQIERGKTT